MRQWDGPKRLRDRLGSILGRFRALRGTLDADRDASTWSPNLVLGVSQGPDRSSSLSSVTRSLIFGAGCHARAGSERCFGHKTFGPAQKIFRTQNRDQTLTTSRPDLVRTLLLEQNFRHSVEDFSHAKSRSHFENDDAKTPGCRARAWSAHCFWNKTFGTA